LYRTKTIERREGNVQAGRGHQMFSFYLKKTFVDQEPGIDIVNIQYWGTRRCPEGC
jgi:hypothetical protein